MPLDPEVLEALRTRHKLEREHLEQVIQVEIAKSSEAIRAAQDKTARLRAQLQISSLLLKEEAALFKQKSDAAMSARRELAKRQKEELQQFIGGDGEN